MMALDFGFHFNWFVQHEIRLIDPLSHSVLTCLEALLRAGHWVGAHYVTVLSNYNLHLNRKMLSSKRCWPCGKAQHD